MKKFLVILMVVAMVSFLFVGCMPSVTPDVDEDEDEVAVPALIHPPIITAVTGLNVPSSATQYVTKSDKTVDGSAEPNSKVQVYINGIVVGAGYAQWWNGQFSVLVPKAKLGVDGAYTLYATATVAGLTESAKSNEVKFTLDTVPPKIASAVGDSSEGVITVTFNEAVDETTAELPLNWKVNDLTAVTTPVVLTAVLKSSKVVEVAYTIGTEVEDDIFAVTCLYDGTATPVKDKAGNAITADTWIFGTIEP